MLVISEMYLHTEDFFFWIVTVIWIEIHFYTLPHISIAMENVFHLSYIFFAFWSSELLLHFCSNKHDSYAAYFISCRIITLLV